MNSDSLKNLLALILSFPTFRRRQEEISECFETEIGTGIFLTFNSHQFATLCRPMSSGQKDAALFCLSVWNPHTDWNEQANLSRGGSGKFDLHHALANWDDSHRQAFINWAVKPWWI